MKWNLLNGNHQTLFAARNARYSGGRRAGIFTRRPEFPRVRELAQSGIHIHKDAKGR
jgi:hypothetical protein